MTYGKINNENSSHLLMNECIHKHRYGMYATLSGKVTAMPAIIIPANHVTINKSLDLTGKSLYLLKGWSTATDLSYAIKHSVPQPARKLKMNVAAIILHPYLTSNILSNLLIIIPSSYNMFTTIVMRTKH